MLSIDDRLNQIIRELIGSGITLEQAVEAFEGEVIKKALAREGGHRARTAKALGVSLRTLQYKLARYRIE